MNSFLPGTCNYKHRCSQAHTWASTVHWKLALLNRADVSILHHEALSQNFSFCGHMLSYPRFPSTLTGLTCSRAWFIVGFGRIGLSVCPGAIAWKCFRWFWPTTMSNWAVLCLHAPCSQNHQHGAQPSRQTLPHVPSPISGNRWSICNMLMNISMAVLAILIHMRVKCIPSVEMRG